MSASLRRMSWYCSPLSCTRPQVSRGVMVRLSHGASNTARQARGSEATLYSATTSGPPL
jgi:hypothetical protein